MDDSIIARADILNPFVRDTLPIGATYVASPVITVVIATVIMVPINTHVSKFIGTSVVDRVDVVYRIRSLL